MRQLRITLGRLQRWWRRAADEGQVMAMLALLMAALMGFTAMAIDVGSLAADRRDLQNAADAMALAAAMDLPDAGDAQDAALEWAEKNGVSPEEVQSVEVLQQSLPNRPNPQVTVTLTRDHDFVFARALGIDSADVEVSASAIKTSLGGGGDIVPWSVLKSVKDGANPGDQVVLKYDANHPENGNFGALAIDGTGSSTYRDSIKYGTDSTICTEPAVAHGCEETAPECNDAECSTEPGNMTGPTRQGVDYRTANTHSSCDAFEEVFLDNGDGTFRFDQECNPFVAGSKASLRVIIVPVIDDLDHGRDEVTIKELALFFLDGYEHGKCSGNSCEIKGRFVKANATVGGLVGVYDEESLVHFVRLVE